ncbi:MAG: Asp-tRNA(Asn)/Glu-tRNA(Gln) amidotransferase subunit GatB [bacterium]
MKYVPTIGIEVHAQLMTRSKLFCGCSTRFAAAPNHNTCPVCLGFPGVLPVLNRSAVEMVIKTALALNCEIPALSRFARKNYFYPDLPKAYQISQYELPIGRNGWLAVEAGGGTKRVRINRVHLEEDAGKLIHEGGDVSCVDYNRAGVPLMEIVTEADIENSEDAAAYLTSLRTLLMYIEVCDGNMEEGSLRCEPNVSLRPADADVRGTKTELKNLNSFKAVRRGLEYEIERQRGILESGGAVVQETRRWDEASQTTRPMRSKEEAHDYRYFPEPDLVPLEVGTEWQDELKKGLPEMPWEKKRRFMHATFNGYKISGGEYALPEEDADRLTSSRPLADYFEKIIKASPEETKIDVTREGAAAVRGDLEPQFIFPLYYKTVSNWVLNELLGALNESGKTIEECPIKPEDFAKLLDLIRQKKISGRIAKDVFKEMFATGKNPEDIVGERDLTQTTDVSEILKVVRRVIEANPGPVSDYRAGKKKALGFLMGQAMKETKGKADPVIVSRILREFLEGT